MRNATTKSTTSVSSGQFRYASDSRPLVLVNSCTAGLLAALTTGMGWLSWLETHTILNLMGVLLLCAGGTALGAWAGFLYATYGDVEVDRFKVPLGLVNGFLGGAALTDVAKSEQSVLLGFLRSTAEFCGFADNTAPVVWALIVFAFCGFMFMYYNKRLLLNLATQLTDNELLKVNQAMATLGKEASLVRAEPGAKPVLTNKLRQAVDLVIQTEPESVETVENLRARGEAYYLRGNYKAAKEWMQRALEMNPEDPKTLVSFAQIYLGEGKQADAVPLLEQASKLPDAPMVVWKLLGYAYLWSEETVEDAEAASLRYLHQYPDDNSVKLNLACVYGQRGPENEENRRKCLQLLGEVFREDPEERDTVRKLTAEGQDFEEWVDDEEFQELLNPRG